MTSRSRIRGQGASACASASLSACQGTTLVTRRNYTMSNPETPCILIAKIGLYRALIVIANWR